MDITPSPTPEPPSLPAWTDADRRLSEHAQQQMARSVSPHTLRVRRRDWDHFIGWCRDQGRVPLPCTPQTLADYISYLTRIRTRTGNRLAPNSIEGKLSSVRAAHTHAGASVDALMAKKVLKSYRRERDGEGFRVRRAETVSVEQLAAMSRAAGDSVIGKRDRMVVLLAFQLLARRSEMTRIRISDVVFTPDGGMDVRLVRTKTDAEAVGQVLHVFPDDVRVCAVAATRAWLAELEEQGITGGMLVRQVSHGSRVMGQVSDRLVNRVVQGLAAEAGVDRRVSGHTLRRSPVTHMVENGVPEARIMRRGGWSSMHQVQNYVAEAQDARHNPMGGLGRRLDGSE